VNAEVWKQIARELNSITQLARGHPNAERITRRVARLRDLLRPKKETAAGEKRRESKPTRRRQLWRRDPRCFWCGRETDIRTVNGPDSATVEHIYHRGHPKRRQSTRRHLPDTVLACRRCNNERGSPPTTTHQTCPLLSAVKL